MRMTRSASQAPNNEAWKGRVAVPAPSWSMSVFEHKKASVVPEYLDESHIEGKIRHLSKSDQQSLRLKQMKVRQTDSQIARFTRSNRMSSPTLAEAAAATLLFVWEGSSTAFCISPTGLLLTGAHCIAETPAEYARTKNQTRWLLFASGDPVQAKPVAFDPKRDLALLQITAAPSSFRTELFPYIRLSSSPPKFRAPLLCIGSPGTEDLELVDAAECVVETGYDVLHISDGKFRGLNRSQDVQDNSEIGALKHDCWTYWGHSGAPLIDANNGGLVGVHSSWDDETGMRRGVAWEAVKAFLEEECQAVETEKVATAPEQSRRAGGSSDNPIVL
ncbi:hypothetical protein CKM354_000519000 [Cercospora kikuchii]|uniref:Uncharacterized protein n=1 Tax=Cercospora kikuchii TaxID=84275 RepID=A0A9P3CLG7_9PEZI|nr:uncharacterized protein CKM354_000519000 [Cercospora kikuchii]GIZ41905.1 hypothetical protein CKM354_000519000 [Cercospora kikuchii]